MKGYKALGPEQPPSAAWCIRNGKCVEMRTAQGGLWWRVVDADKPKKRKGAA